VGALALTVADKVPAALPTLATEVGRALLGDDMVPGYSGELPAGGRRRRVLKAADPVAVYFSSCTTTMFGPTDGGVGVAESFIRLCDRAGISIATPDGLPSLCCGTPWKSKGLTLGYQEMKERVTLALRRATRDGALPVVCDASSCTEGLRLLLDVAGEHPWIDVVDAVTFVAARVLPALPEGERITSLTLHPTCSSTSLGINNDLMTVASAVADEVVVPDDWGCCAFAGDRGMLHPELTASATASESAEVRARLSVAHASLNRTCELGMTRATGQPYLHILELLDRSLSTEPNSG
jgi:D-lactate dehydrogenase